MSKDNTEQELRVDDLFKDQMNTPPQNNAQEQEDNERLKEINAYFQCIDENVWQNMPLSSAEKNIVTQVIAQVPKVVCDPQKAQDGISWSKRLSVLSYIAFITMFFWAVLTYPSQVFALYAPITLVLCSLCVYLIAYALAYPVHLLQISGLMAILYAIALSMALVLTYMVQYLEYWPFAVHDATYNFLSFLKGARFYVFCITPLVLFGYLYELGKSRRFYAVVARDAQGQLHIHERASVLTNYFLAVGQEQKLPETLCLRHTRQFLKDNSVKVHSILSRSAHTKWLVHILTVLLCCMGIDVVHKVARLILFALRLNF